MAHANEDLRRPVIYSSDAYFVRRIPLALLLSFAGLAPVSSTGSVNDASFAFMAFLFLLVFGALTAFIFFWFDRFWDMLFERVRAVLAGAAALLLALVFLAIYSPCFIDSHSKACRRALTPPRQPADLVTFDRIAKLADPIEVMGWLLFFFGLLWIAVTLLLRVAPVRPILRLTLDGITFNRPGWLQIQIPWREVRDVGAPVYCNDAGARDSVEHWVAVSVSRAYFEQHVANSSGMFLWKGARAVVEPRGDLIQVILNSKYLTVDPKDIRETAKNRWKAFGTRETAPQQSAFETGPVIVYGWWTLDGSWWQAIQFLVPIIGIIALALHAGGMLPF